MRATGVQEHIVAARVDGDVLIIAADSGAWSSRLRWTQAAFADVARRHNATSCRFKVLPKGRDLPGRPLSAPSRDR